jgi:hypothetical protein
MYFLFKRKHVVCYDHLVTTTTVATEFMVKFRKFSKFKRAQIFMYTTVCLEISPVHDVACILALPSVPWASYYINMLLSPRHASRLPTHQLRPRKPIPKSGCLFWHYILCACKLDCICRDTDREVKLKF